ncbi:MAG TPA: NAD-dependent epimerase/dehydratase family protein [Methanocella sp.]|nr:NAD-dependent epimerase/dehydratase family protein [Methanocella sp.]
MITGGMGQVGSYICDALSGTRSSVVVLDNFSSSASYPGPSAEIVNGDIRDREVVGRLVRESDYIIHCAAQIYVSRSVSDPGFDADNNIMGTLNLLETARAASVKRFVYFSSAAVYGDPTRLPIEEPHAQNPLSPYGVSKLAGEKYALAFHKVYGLPTTVIRPFNIYSPRQDPSNPYSGVISRFIDRVEAGQPPVIFGDGSATRDFVSVHDVVNMVLLMLDDPACIGRAFNCGTGKWTRIDALARLIASLCGREDLGPELQPERPGDIRHSYASIAQAGMLLGYRPTVSLEEGLREIVEHKQAAGAPGEAAHAPL